jgi:hypothetical protein
MSALEFEVSSPGYRFGLKGRRAAEWLAAHGIAVPPTANTWTRSSQPPVSESSAPGVYPVLREDAAFLLAGEGSQEVLAQVCNVNFADLGLDSRAIIMTLMIGVSVLVVPEGVGAQSRYRIWCDPTFGHYLGDSLGAVVIECGGRVRGVTQ